MEDVAGAVGVDDLVVGDIQRRHEPLGLRFVVPEHAARAHGHGADLAAARAQISQHLAGRQLHLLAQTLGHHRGADETEQVVGVGTQAAAIKRGQDTGLMANLGVVDGGIREVAIDMERAAAR
jgi:hypothetical protein